MNVGELIGVLSSYPEETPVATLEDWGCGYVLRELDGITDTSEFEEDRNPYVVVLFTEVGQ